MYNNSYLSYPQATTDRIDAQIAELQKLKSQVQQVRQPIASQPSINQTFQLASNNQTMRYANSLDDVNKELVYSDTPFFSQDLSVMWLKSVNNNVRTYELKEIVQKDDKDLIIESLQMQINELRKEMSNNEQPTNERTDVTVESEKPKSISTVRAVKTKSK